MSMINLQTSVEGFVKIHDPVTGEVFVDKKNAIHYENMSYALARSISSGPLLASNGSQSFIHSFALGNGGTNVQPTGVIVYKTPNYTGTSADLYSQTYSKIVNDNYAANTDALRNKITINHLSGKAYTDILISCYLDYGEPNGQTAFDNTTDFNDTFVFDELGIKSETGKLLTHVIFHPVQKSLNRVIQIDYTIRIQTLTNLSSQ